MRMSYANAYLAAVCAVIIDVGSEGNDVVTVLVCPATSTKARVEPSTLRSTIKVSLCASDRRRR